MTDENMDNNEMRKIQWSSAIHLDDSLERHPLLVQLGSNNETMLRHVTNMGHPKAGPLDWLDEDEWEDEDCIPMHEWQIMNPLSCNVMHEIEMENHLEIINCGDSRCAFRLLDSHNRQEETLVVKLVRFSYDFDDDPFYPRGYERARMDALIMERLKKSPYVLDIYGACGVSQILPYSNGGSLYDRIKIAREKGDYLDPTDKLRIALQVSSGVADLHTFESNEVASLTHNDLCCHQFMLMKDGVYRLMDFHSGGYITRNRNSNRVCKDLPKHIDEELIKMRAPEDLVDLYEDDEDTELIYRDKTDVYSLGNVLYYLLTNKWILEGVDLHKAREMLVEGKRSEIPSKLENSTNAAEQAILRSIRAAWTHDPYERPTAREITDFLDKELHKIIGGARGQVVPVILPALPANHSFSDEDFRANLNFDH